MSDKAIIKLRATVLLLSSGHDGEVVSAAHAINRQLVSLGKDWHWLADQLSGGGSGCASAELNTAYDKGWDDGYKRGRDDGKFWGEPPKPPAIRHQEAAAWILQNCMANLRGKEKEFLEDMLNWRGQPTERQMAWLGMLATKFGYATA